MDSYMWWDDILWLRHNSNMFGLMNGLCSATERRRCVWVGPQRPNEKSSMSEFLALSFLAWRLLRCFLTLTTVSGLYHHLLVCCVEYGLMGRGLWVLPKLLCGISTVNRVMDGSCLDEVNKKRESVFSLPLSRADLLVVTKDVNDDWLGWNTSAASLMFKTLHEFMGLWSNNLTTRKLCSLISEKRKMRLAEKIDDEIQ